MVRRIPATTILLGFAFACGRGGSDANGGGTAAAGLSSGEFRPLVVGEPAPAYEAPTLGGDTVRLGGRGPVTILNVWATWCTSCREEMADLEGLHRQFAPRGVRVIGVSVDGGDGARVRRFVEGERLTFTVAHDPEQRIQQLYQVVGVPETFVIGADGRLLWRRVGNIHPVVDSVRALVGASGG
jgi:cytochrome c biogenesis protein CcmG, thiol:disulfide interchange protein DsbE